MEVDVYVSRSTHGLMRKGFGDISHRILWWPDSVMLKKPYQRFLIIYTVNIHFNFHQEIVPNLLFRNSTKGALHSTGGDS